MVLHNLAGKDTVNHFCFCKYFSRDDVFGAGMRFSKFKRLMVVAMFLFSRQGLIAQGNTNKELADSGTNSNNQSNQLSGYRLNDLVKPGASSIDWSNAFQEVMNDSTIFYSRLGISTGVTVPFINAPFQLNQFIYYNNITGVDFSFDNFKFSFDKNKFSEEQRKKVQVSLLDSLYIDTLKLLEDTLKTFEDLRLRVSGEGFISDKMLFTKRIKEMQDSLSMGFQIDTAAFLAYQNKQTEIKQIESDYRSFFEKKKKYQQQVYDGRKRVEQKVAQYKHLDSKEVLNELESKKMLSLSEKILSNLQSLEIGKCNIRYNSFFLQNLPIRGFYTTYLTRKNIYLSAASGKEVSYF